MRDAIGAFISLAAIGILIYYGVPESDDDRK